MVPLALAPLVIAPFKRKAAGGRLSMRVPLKDEMELTRFEMKIKEAKVGNNIFFR